MVAAIYFYSDKSIEHIYEITDKLELTHLFNKIAFGVSDYVKLEVGVDVLLHNEPYTIERIELLLKEPYEAEDSNEITIQVYTKSLR